MAAQVHAIFEGKELEKFLARLEKKFGNIRRGSSALGAIISSIVFRDIQTHFDEESGPNGKWEAWSKAYAEHRARTRGKGARGDKILQLTGRLRQSIAPGTGKFKTAPGGVLFFSRVPYAAAHDEGGARMPQRKFMWLSDKAKDELAEQTLKWIADVED